MPFMLSIQSIRALQLPGFAEHGATVQLRDSTGIVSLTVKTIYLVKAKFHYAIQVADLFADL